MRKYLISKGRIFAIMDFAGARDRATQKYLTTDQPQPIDVEGSLREIASELGIKEYIILPEDRVISYLYSWVQDEIEDGRLEKLR